MDESGSSSSSEEENDVREHSSNQGSDGNEMEEIKTSLQNYI